MATSDALMIFAGFWCVLAALHLLAKPGGVHALVCSCTSSVFVVGSLVLHQLGN